MKHIFTTTVILVGLFFGAFATGQTPSTKPNIIVILSDDCGYNEFSMQGGTIATPCIDSIAANGVRFTNGYVTGCVCSPTRAGLMTGRYQHRFGHEFNFPPRHDETVGLSLEETTIADVLKSGGYRTIALGKWHLGNYPQFNPCERGFNDFYGFMPAARSYWPLETSTRNNLMLNREQVILEKFDYLTDHLADKAVEYIKAARGKPFFVYLAFNATHTPMEATEADLARANGNTLTAMTFALDRAVGKVLDVLKEEKIEKNTLVIFLNDNGGPGGYDNRPLRGTKSSLWEGGIRIPFAMQWPNVIPAGKVDDRPVISLDIFSTAMAAAGIEQSPGKPLDGVNLLPYLTGKKMDRPHQVLYWRYADAWAVRENDMKLVVPARQSKQKAPFLFDLSKDISETKDLAAERPDDVQRLKNLYNVWQATHPPIAWPPDFAIDAEQSRNLWVAFP